MPRYFISSYDGFLARNPDGIELPDVTVLRTMLRRMLAAMMSNEGERENRDEFWADVLDEVGNRVMTAKISLSSLEP